MAPFTQNPECPKCRNTNVSQEYARSLDKLRCECQTCAYTWTMNPADSKQDPAEYKAYPD